MPSFSEELAAFAERGALFAVELRCPQCGQPGNQNGPQWECIAGHVWPVLCGQVLQFGNSQVRCERENGHDGAHWGLISASGEYCSWEEHGA